jgi:hypothetical protein
MLTANLKFKAKKSFFFSLFANASKYLRSPFAENKQAHYVPIKHKQMSFVSNGGKFKLYTVLNGLIFPTPTQLRISFERAIYLIYIFMGSLS